MFIVNVEGAIWKKNKWLIIQRSKLEKHAGGMLSLVGGKVATENNTLDILEKTLKREIFEEVGISLKGKMHYLHSTSFVADTGENVINIIFLCEHGTGDAYPKSPDEVETVYWLTKEEIIGHPKAPAYLLDSIKRAELVKETC